MIAGVRRPSYRTQSASLFFPVPDGFYLGWLDLQKFHPLTFPSYQVARVSIFFSVQGAALEEEIQPFCSGIAGKGRITRIVLSPGPGSTLPE